MPMLALGALRCKPLFGALTIERPFATVDREQMYAVRSSTRRSGPVQSDLALRHLYRWALVLVAALAVMLALSRVAWGGEAAATVVVQPGDTLWTIAAERYPGDDTRARIDEIERLNNLSSPVIAVGETLRLPA
jgi:nucleoid-associated protein YgaU